MIIITLNTHLLSLEKIVYLINIDNKIWNSNEYHDDKYISIDISFTFDVDTSSDDSNRIPSYFALLVVNNDITFIFFIFIIFTNKFC